MLPAVEARKESEPVEGGKITEGQRNSRLISYGGALRRRGVTEEGLLAALSALNGSECDPPLSKREVAQVAASAARYEPHSKLDVVDRINSEFAHLLSGGKSLILRIRKDGSWDTIRWADFRRLLQNWPKVPIGENKFVHPADYWLGHPDRRDYPGGIVFEPGEIRTKDAFNLFRGWAYEPKEGGQFGLLREHVRKNVCRDNPACEDWVWSWCANIFQNPDRKAGTALFLRGRFGTGKSKLGELLGELLGPHHTTASKARSLTGNFNDHLEGILLFQLEEAFWAGDKDAEGVLKDLITGPKYLMEKKYHDPIPVKNLLNVFGSSNQDWVVPAGPMERRFTVLDMGEGRMQDDDFFADMTKEMEEKDGYSGLLHFLLHYPINKAAIRKPFRTAALSEQIAHSLSPIEEWFFDMLEDGVLTQDGNGEGICLTYLLHDDYVKKTSYGRKRPYGKSRFGSWLHTKVPGLKKLRLKPEDDGTRVAYYQFPPLEECRKAFDSQRTWPEPNEWQLWEQEF